MEKKMSKVSLQNGGGPGSSISLAPETIRVRNALIEKFTGEPLDEMNHFMNTALVAEKNELRRLGILAARIFLLRTRIANLQDFNRDPSLTNISEINVGELDLGGTNMHAVDSNDDNVAKTEDGWARLKMTSPGEIQGVRFLSGAIIDAKPEDAEKLIRSGKAVRVDENGDSIDFDEDDFDNQDGDDSNAAAVDHAEDTNGNSEANDSDGAEADENTSAVITDEQTVEAENDEQPAVAAADGVAIEDDTIANAEQSVSPDNELSDNADDKT
jgi:hypothetical protein